jgi:tetratricopeptide (TPR) repeat protein
MNRKSFRQPALLIFSAFALVAQAQAQSGATRPRRVPPAQPAADSRPPAAARPAAAQQPARPADDAPLLTPSPAAQAGGGGDTARAYALFQQKQFAEAAREARRVAAADPSNSEAWKLAGFAEFGLKQYAEAAASLQRALDLQRAAGAEDANTADALGKSYALAEQYDRALPLLVAATTRANAKPDAETYYFRGLSEYRTKRTDDAVRSFEAAVKADPKNAVSLFYLGRIAYERGQPDAAISALNRATTADPRFTEGWRLLTVAYLLRAGQAGGTGPKAAADYLSAVRTSDALLKLSADESAMTLNGQALIGAQQFARAAAVLERAAANPGVQGSTLYLLGVAHSRAKNFPRAVAALERAAAKSPEDANVYRELGYALEVSKQYARALAAYERGAALAPNEADLKESADRVRPFAK